VDRAAYAERIRDFLPNRIVDIHAHVWTAAQTVKGLIPGYGLASWPARVASTCPTESLLDLYHRMLPGQTVVPLVFGNPLLAEDVNVMNAYVAREAARHGLPALLLSRPEWPAEVLEQKIRAGGFSGIKVYLTYAPAGIKPRDIRIFDFLPREHLRVLDRHGWVAMVHLPRPGRIRDPQNVADLLEIERDYGRARIVVAHAGRAYTNRDIGDAFDRLAPARELCFDFSANTNEEVFRRLIAAMGPSRILFGTDLPITCMRMKRIEENGRYVNLVPPILYGDVSDDPNMREASAEEAASFTFFLYEEIDAFRRASAAEGLTRSDIEQIFRGNAERLLQRDDTRSRGT
jgi:predicted TIM-barrel fold metal-dependent hydrolase